jgi:phosphonate transport system substrate-binding protein
MSARLVPVHAALIALLSERTGIDISWRPDLSFEQVDLSFVCGLPYVRRNRDLSLLAAPVMTGERYGGLPVYFTDMIVRADDPAAAFDDLAGRKIAVNNPDSNSGCLVILNRLLLSGTSPSFFGNWWFSGAHLNSLEALLNGQCDCTGIDSTVLESEIRHDPGLAERIRVVETIGPWPIPPVVVLGSVPQSVQNEMRDALLVMHDEPKGRAALDLGSTDRFVGVADSDYAPILEAARLVESTVTGWPEAWTP